MEHQTPSGFPGNFRKRKVLGTLWFPSGLPETLGQAKPLWSRFFFFFLKLLNHFFFFFLKLLNQFFFFGVELILKFSF